MKALVYLAVLAIIAFSQATKADTLTLVGGGARNYSIAWGGEGWKDVGWCGDTLAHDQTPDTTIQPPDTIHGFFVSNPIFDTVFTSVSTSFQDSLAITTKTIDTRTILRDSLNAPVVDIVDIYKTIVDSDIVVNCPVNDFIADTGGITDSSSYFNWRYKFRNWYAQLPFVWNGWAGGYDSATLTKYKYLLITYEGILPIHQVTLSFFYATWGQYKDTMSSFLKRGDGVGTLAASPAEWKTVVIPIPDSVYLPGITGIVLAIGNVPNGGGGQTSEVGNLKIDRIALIAPSEDVSVRHTDSRRSIRQDRFHFSPKTAGTIMVSVYSLNGALLCSKALNVDPSKSYSIRRLAQLQDGMTHGQMRIVKVRGAGVDLREKIW